MERQSQVNGLSIIAKVLLYVENDYDWQEQFFVFQILGVRV
jgi:hypothetical protein